MMIYLYLRHTVADYARWRETFDNHIVARQAGGATHEAYILANVENPNDIILLLGWCDLRQARLFSHSISWQRAVKKMGVIGEPEVLFLEGVG